MKSTKDKLVNSKKEFQMNMNKIFLTTTILFATGTAHAEVQGTADIAVTGSINGANTCSIAVDGGGALDAGVHDIADLVSTGDLISEFKEFNATVNCTFPTVIAVKYTSSLPQPTASHELGIYQTSSGKTAAHLYAATSTMSVPTAGGADQAYAAIGDQDLTTISTASTLTPAASGNPISGVIGDVKNIYTVIDTANNPIAATSFMLPFALGVWNNDTSTGWLDDIAGTTFSLSSTVTLELHSL